MEQLPPAYIVSTKKQARRTPELYYSIAVSDDTLYNYAIKHDLIPNLGFATPLRVDTVACYGLFAS
ncbi:hypothetical protein EWM64_g7245 [Hericium alpestre]|uniref:Uncharacterized protein n=1 Tax=Hericium alpestre TaxID=135208 RepID=A0A4Y9ZPE5_9AGAM|nr:hypothetical protein EWM64_g7245 [Hericium alpestre]